METLATVTHNSVRVAVVVTVELGRNRSHRARLEGLEGLTGDDGLGVGPEA